VDNIITEDFIDKLITRRPFSVVVCFLLGVDTSLIDLKKGVFLKKIGLTYIHEFLLSGLLLLLYEAFGATTE
jgi:hypothetical protein